MTVYQKIDLTSASFFRQDDTVPRSIHGETNRRYTVPRRRVRTRFELTPAPLRTHYTSLAIRAHMSEECRLMECAKPLPRVKWGFTGLTGSTDVDALTDHEVFEAEPDWRAAYEAAIRGDA